MTMSTAMESKRLGDVEISATVGYGKYMCIEYINKEYICAVSLLVMFQIERNVRNIISSVLLRFYNLFWCFVFNIMETIVLWRDIKFSN